MRYVANHAAQPFSFTSVAKHCGQRYFYIVWRVDAVVSGKRHAILVRTKVIIDPVGVTNHFLNWIISGSCKVAHELAFVRVPRATSVMRVGSLPNHHGVDLASS